MHGTPTLRARGFTFRMAVCMLLAVEHVTSRRGSWRTTVTQQGPGSMAAYWRCGTRTRGRQSGVMHVVAGHAWYVEQ